MQRGKGKVEALERKLDRYPLTATRFSFPYVHFGKFLLARVLLGRKNRSLVLVETFQLSSKPFLSFSLFFFPPFFPSTRGLTWAALFTRLAINPQIDKGNWRKTRISSASRKGKRRQTSHEIGKKRGRKLFEIVPCPAKKYANLDQTFFPPLSCY